MIKPPGRITSGDVWFGGRRLADLDEDRIRALRLTGIALVPQGSMNSLNPVLRIGRQIADAFADHASVTVLLLSSALIDAPLLRFTVAPDATNGLRLPSQIMLDKTMTVMRAKIGQAFGRLGAEALLEVERRLAVFLGIAK